MPRVIATHHGQGWILTADLGTTLRSATTSVQDLWHWEKLLPIYAELQIEVADRIHDLLDLGVPDRRLSQLPEQYELVLDDADALFIDEPNGLTATTYQFLRDYLPRFRTLCSQLADLGLPATLHHDDFHDANIFLQDDQYVFSDWGESHIAHPFFSLLIPPRTIAWRFHLGQGDPLFLRLRDAYLEPWTRFDSRDNLLAALQLAHPLSMASRAVTYYRVLENIPEPYRSEDADAVPAWFQDFHETVTTGRVWPAIPAWLQDLQELEKKD